MDKHQIHSALDDYFSSMLSVPVVEDAPKVSLDTKHLDTVQLDTKHIDTKHADNTIAEPGTQLQRELQPVLTDVAVAVMSEFKIPEPDGSGSISDLDQLLGSVVDIDLADMDLSVLDHQDITIETELDIITAPAVDMPNDTVIDAADVVDVALVPTAIEVDVIEDSVVADNSISSTESHSNLGAVPNVVVEADKEPAVEWQNIELEERFQALFFEVAGVTFAVPLTELGGIHQADTVNSLFGKPDWYLGIMQHRDKKLSVVDTAQWVMPEQNMGAVDYKYQIQLSESNWVLGCETLHGTETLNSIDIKWRSTPGSRPWLAGMVKSRMCVLLHVTEMIKLLDNGINIHGQ